MTTIKVFAAYATPECQTVVELEVPPGTTVGGLLERLLDVAPFAAVDLERTPIGIFGERVGRARVLEPGDRVEVLRALQIDPKTERRRRARES